MKKTLVGTLVLALLIAVAVPALAAPWWANRPGPAAGRGPGGGPLAVGQTIPAEVHAVIEAATQAAAAKVLGMTPEALRQALATKRMVAIAAEKNVPIATVQTAMRTARAEAINELVKTGKLTAQQAALLLQAGPGRAPGHGPGMGRGPRW